MKKYLVTATIVTAMSGASLALASGLGLGIKGSHHDFTDNLVNGAASVTVTETGAGGWNDGRGEICRTCHAPHDHGMNKYQNGTLWNHAVSAVAAYDMYNNAWSTSLTGTQDAQPTGNSKLCLGCHDGTVGVDTFDKYAGGAVNITAYSAGYKVGGDLTAIGGTVNDLRGTHPISIAYPAADIGAVGGLTDPATATWSLSGKTVASTLQGGKIQCSTCHDIHDSTGVAVPGTHLLRAPQKGTAGNADGNASKLCLTCHSK